jgi:diguanylate cyclase (GGDEF)-like protein
VDFSIFTKKRGGLPPGRAVSLIAVLVFFVATSVTLLSLAWPHLWGLFVVLQTIALAPLLYALVWRPFAKAGPLSEALPPQGTGLVDELTRTLNRRGITSSLIEAMAQSQRYSTPVSLVRISVDGVEELTERLGDEAQGAILESVAATLGEVLRLPDRLGRYQDWEFLVVLPQTRAEQAAIVAERLRAAVAANPILVKGEGATVTLSGGVAEFGRGQDLERFLANAREALRQAQKEGGDRVRSFKPLRTKGTSAS